MEEREKLRRVMAAAVGRKRVGGMKKKEREQANEAHRLDEPPAAEAAEKCV